MLIAKIQNLRNSSDEVRFLSNYLFLDGLYTHICWRNLITEKFFTYKIRGKRGRTLEKRPIVLFWK